MSNIAGNQITRDRNHGSMADGAIGVDRNIGGTTADIDHAHTQFFFVFSQHCLAARQGLQHNLIHVQTATVHAFLDILQRGDGTGNDVYAGIQTNTTHANGLFDTGLVINNVFLHYGMQNIVIRRDINRFGRFDGAVDIGLRYFAVFDFHHAL